MLRIDVLGDTVRRRIFERLAMLNASGEVLSMSEGVRHLAAGRRQDLKVLPRWIRDRANRRHAPIYSSTVCDAGVDVVLEGFAASGIGKSMRSRPKCRGKRAARSRIGGGRQFDCRG